MVGRAVGAAMRIRRHAATAALALIVAACSAVPPSLAPAVRETAIDYGNVMDRFADRALLSNVLRARDYLPLNFSDLSSISASLQLQASLGLGFPLQNLPSSMGLGTGSLGLSSSSSPVLTLGSLDTQGFIMSMIQPVSPMYVASKWNDGYDRETLMFLFIKSVKFADGKTYFNNPDDPEEMVAFDRLVEEMVVAQVTLKPLTLLSPIGPAFAMTANAHEKEGSGIDLAKFNVVKSVAGGELHVGNADCSLTGETGCVQLYKAYPAQVALCVDAAFDPTTDEYKFDDHVIFGKEEARAQRREEAVQPNGQSHFAAGRALMHARLRSAGNTGAGSVPPPLPPMSDGAMPRVTASLQPSRVSVILGADDCKPDEIILSPQTEESFSTASGDFAQIEWRSISEAIQYLGAVVRNEDTAHVPVWRNSRSRLEQKLIEVVPDDQGLITVDYFGHDYSVPGERRDGARYPSDMANDHGLQALSILNELIGTAKISGNVPLPHPVQFVVP